MAELNIEELSYGYENQMILKSLDLKIPTHSFVGVIGPNGSGKSTLLKNIYRALKPQKGVVYLNQKNIHQMNYKESSKQMSVVSQENDLDFHFTVEEVVKMGRTPYKKLFDPDTKEDEQYVHQALEKVGLLDYIDKDFSHLSGGEKQRVLVARALCQNAELLILDEPTNHLDIYYQLQIFDLIKELDITIFSAIHDLNIASHYCDYIYVLKDGMIYDQGSVNDVINEKMIKEVFQVDAQVIDHPLTHKKHITYLPQSMKGY